MIRLQRISTADGFLYEYMEQLITAAFPPEEYRPLENCACTLITNLISITILFSTMILL